MSAEIRPVGRPTLYRPEYAKQAYGYCMLGATVERMAELFDVATCTVSEWLIHQPEFAEAVKRGRERADVLVAKSLFKRATGITKKVSKTIIDKFGEERQLTSEEYFPPDTAAAFIWLKNRQPKLWRDKHEVEVTGKDGGAIQLDITESARLIAFVLAQAQQGAHPPLVDVSMHPQLSGADNAEPSQGSPATDATT